MLCMSAVHPVCQLILVASFLLSCFHRCISCTLIVCNNRVFLGRDLTLGVLLQYIALSFLVFCHFTRIDAACSSMTNAILQFIVLWTITHDYLAEPAVHMAYCV